MRTAIVAVFAALVAVATCAVMPTVEKVRADNVFLEREKNILRLFHRVHQHNINKVQAEIGASYDIEASIDHYKHPRVVKQFLSYYKKGMLHRGEPFSVYYLKHREQAVLLFELFFFANDYDTFYKTACWARDKVNEGLFVYSFTTAILHREDTQDFVLPPPYEIYPYLYFHHDVIQEAQKFRMKEGSDHEAHHHVIEVNYTLHNQEQLVDYFTEDPNLNAFYWYYRHYYPTWFNSSLYGHTFDHRGEQFYYTHQQIFARYMLERWSNDLPYIVPFEFNKPVKTPYNPHIRYHNGDEMPVRPANVVPRNTDLFYVTDIQNYEKRVADAVDFGYIFDKHLKSHYIYDDEHGIESLGQVIEGTFDSPNPHFYGSLFHGLHLLVGHSVDPFHQIELPPSALEHSETILRDPVYYSLWKLVEHYFRRFKARLRRYTHDELNFEGIKVENVEVDKLYTYLEPFEIGMDNVVYIQTEDDARLIDMRAREHRLNHKPFTYKVDVTSDKDHYVYMRVFLGPKYDYLGRELDLNDRRHYFVELDRFVHHVKAGKNVIERNSHDSSVTAPDPESFRNLNKKVSSALAGKSEFFIDKTERHCGYPQNLLLPKGKKGGMQFTFYVIVTPYVKQDEHDFEPYEHHAFSYCGVGYNHKYPDDKPLGFPFDRTIYSNEFYTPNMYFKDVIIFHKKYEEEVSTVTH